MPEINDLQSYVYGVLQHATIGASEEELREKLTAEDLTPDRIDFILKVAEDIMEVAFEHKDAIQEILLKEDEAGETSAEKVKSFLRSRGVREEYLDHIHTYNIFVYGLLYAEELIEEGSKTGKSEKQLITAIKKELNVDAETAEEMYFTALAKNGQLSEVDTPNIQSQRLRYDDEGQKKPSDFESPLFPLIKGIAFIGVGISNFSVDFVAPYWSLIAIVLGFYYLTKAAIRRNNRDVE